MSSRFSSLQNEEELNLLVGDAQPSNANKATSASLRAVTDFREEKSLDISIAHCSAEELNEFLCQFLFSLKPKKAGAE